MCPGWGAVLTPPAHTASGCMVLRYHWPDQLSPSSGAPHLGPVLYPPLPGHLLLLAQPHPLHRP